MEAGTVLADIDVADDVLEDFTEGQGDDCQVVAPEAKHRYADNHTGHTCHQAAAHHGQHQAQSVAFHHASEASGNDYAYKGAHTHKARMAQTQLTGNAHHQIQRHRHHNVGTDGNQIPSCGVGQHILAGQKLQYDESHNYRSVCKQVGFVFLPDIL